MCFNQKEPNMKTTETPTKRQREQLIGHIVIGPNGRTVPLYTDASASAKDVAGLVDLTQQAVDEACELADAIFGNAAKREPR
jgi:hypothetical protein